MGSSLGVLTTVLGILLALLALLLLLLLVLLLLLFLVLLLPTIVSLFGIGILFGILGGIVVRGRRSRGCWCRLGRRRHGRRSWRIIVIRRIKVQRRRSLGLGGRRRHGRRVGLGLFHLLSLFFSVLALLLLLLLFLLLLLLVLLLSPIVHLFHLLSLINNHLFLNVVRHFFFRSKNAV